jgi:hypothetical protein
MSPSTYDVLDVEDLLVLFEVSIFNVIITISVAVIGTFFPTGTSLPFPLLSITEIQCSVKSNRKEKSR